MLEWIQWIPFLNALWTAFFVVTMFGPLAAGVMIYSIRAIRHTALKWAGALGAIACGYVAVWGLYRLTGLPFWARYLDELAQRWLG